LWGKRRRNKTILTRGKGKKRPLMMTRKGANIDYGRTWDEQENKDRQKEQLEGKKRKKKKKKGRGGRMKTTGTFVKKQRFEQDPDTESRGANEERKRRQPFFSI